MRIMASLHTHPILTFKPHSRFGVNGMSEDYLNTLLTLGLPGISEQVYFAIYCPK